LEFETFFVIYLNKKKKGKMLKQCMCRIRPKATVLRRVGLPHAADQKVGWASAWQPGLAARSPCKGRHGGALANGPVVASQR
jgi:hypothetical protein